MYSSLVNGEIAGHVPADDRGLAYGDGLFETIAVQGGHPGLWQGHMDRLRRGCERLAIPAPPQEVLLRELKTVAAGNARCVVKIIITRGSGGRGYAPPAQCQPCRIVSAHPWPERIEEEARLGVHGVLCETRLALQPQLRGIKHLNRLEQVLAAQEMAAHPGKYGLMRNTEGYLISAVSANLFAVSNGLLLTPRMDRCGVHGVLRDRLLREQPARCERRRITLDLLQEADEVFLCSSVRGIIPLRSLGDSRWAIGPVTRELQTWHSAMLERP
jgi:4-amino-4-deoxychorismate lyase